MSIKTEWDYTSLAGSYLKRPSYANAAIDALLSLANVKGGGKVCDVGAGAAHLTMLLAACDVDVIALEPNDAMRARGVEQTKNFANVRWLAATGEDTKQPAQQFDLVTFGSSFNVCDRHRALEETARILKPRGWFACMWNHRQLDDPIQARIEKIIQDHIPGYDYGTRREDQTDVIDGSGLFGPVVQLRSRVIHKQRVEDCIEAWCSHATLQRQAGDAFDTVTAAIASHLKNLDVQTITVPYSTDIWAAQVR